MIDAILFFNPAAGRAPLSQKRLGSLVDRLRQAGIRCEPVMSDPACPAGASSIDLRNKGLLLVYGGDGTIHQAIQHVATHPVRVGLLPAGTANVLARELGIPLDPDQAIDVITRGCVRRIHLGQSGGRYFHLMAGVGLDAYIIRAVGPRLKKALGVGAYWVAGLMAFRRYPLPQFVMELDGRSYTGTFAVIANARNYGGGLRIAAQADLGDPFLDVCLFTSRRKTRFFRYLSAAFRGAHLSYPDVVYRKVRSVRVDGPSLPMQMDGEIVGQVPASLSVWEPGLEIYAP